MHLVLWNPCSLAESWRLIDVSQELSFADAVVLVGCRLRAKDGRPEVWSLPHHDCYVSGYVKGEDGTNKSAGIAILLKKRKFPKETRVCGLWT